MSPRRLIPASQALDNMRAAIGGVAVALPLVPLDLLDAAHEDLVAVVTALEAERESWKRVAERRLRYLAEFAQCATGVDDQAAVVAQTSRAVCPDCRGELLPGKPPRCGLPIGAPGGCYAIPAFCFGPPTAAAST